MLKKLLGIAIVVAVSCVVEIIHLWYEKVHGPSAFKFKIFPTFNS
jgi:hypothetical protein